jgi:hypothetical protein
MFLLLLVTDPYEEFMQPVSLSVCNSLDSVLSQMNPVHTPMFYFFKICFNIILPSTLNVFRVVSSLYVFRLKFCMYFSSPHACCMPHLSLPPWYDHPNNVWRREYSYIIKLLIMQFVQPSVFTLNHEFSTSGPPMCFVLPELILFVISCLPVSLWETVRLNEER